MGSNKEYHQKVALIVGAIVGKEGPVYAFILVGSSMLFFANW